MVIEVFNRTEYKFILTSKQHSLLEQTIKRQMRADDTVDTPCYSISNIYYDTDDHYLIKHSLSSPNFKEKLRIRAYGNVTLDSIVFLELKKKYNGIVNKRRSKIRLKDAYRLLETKILPKIEPYHNELVLREIQFFLTRYSLKASTMISYDRCAYKTDDFRVTVDQNIRTRTHDLRLEHGRYGDALLKDDIYLLEAKSSNAIPLWFVNELSQLRIYKSSFSKYGKDFVRRYRQIEEREVKKICWTQSLATQQKHRLL
ncbi:MAG: polyphosphate polymerase domain-containing protein [Clostridiales bacterium]|nr:polyphosphate polymerase domain-containing protein [Clostridiales bacterium]